MKHITGCEMERVRGEAAKDFVLEFDLSCEWQSLLVFYHPQPAATSCRLLRSPLGGEVLETRAKGACLITSKGLAKKNLKKTNSKKQAPTRPNPINPHEEMKK